MSIEGLDHVNIRTPHIEATKDFFVNVLELRVGERPNFGQRGYWLYAGATPIVHLSEGPQGSGKSVFGTGSFGHVAFRASGLERMRERLAEFGIEFAEQLVPDRGQIQLFVREPSGVQVELQFSASEAL